jgi:hypothetical protein
VQDGQSSTARAARRLCTLAATLAVTLLLAATARAEVVSVAGRDVVLTAPSGYCALDEADGSDRVILDQLQSMQRGLNTVLLAYGNCHTIARSREGHGRPIIEGQFLAPHETDSGPRVIEGRSRADVVREVAASLPQIPWDEVTRLTNEHLRNEGVPAQSGITPLGVLHQDDEAVYFGILLTATTTDGRMRTAVAVVGTTLVNKVIITLNATRFSMGEGTVKWLLRDQRRNMRALIEANDKALRRSADSTGGLNWRELGVSAAIGSAIFIALLLAWMLVQRVRDAL